MTQSAPISQADYARHRKALGLPGATRQAVSKAIDDGRLARSVVQVQDGKRKLRKIRSAAEADAEWDANTDYRGELPIAEPGTHARARREQAEDAAQVLEDDDAPITELKRRITLEKLRNLRRRNEDADAAAERERGEWIRVEDAREDVLQLFGRVRMRLLAVASQVQQEHPSMDARVAKTLRDRLREALEELAG